MRLGLASTPFREALTPSSIVIPSLRPSKKSRPADMCGWRGHIQGNLALRVCEAVRPSARFSGKFCPLGSGGEARPVDETASRRWRSAPIFAARERLRKSAKRKRIRGKEFLSRDCAQKWVPPKAWRFSPRSVCQRTPTKSQGKTEVLA